MTNDFIDRRAAGFGEIVVVERRGVAVPCYTSLNRQKHVGYSWEATSEGPLSPHGAVLQLNEVGEVCKNRNDHVYRDEKL